jgi:hypothetical protein
MDSGFSTSTPDVWVDRVDGPGPLPAASFCATYCLTQQVRGPGGVTRCGNAPVGANGARDRRGVVLYA